MKIKYIVGSLLSALILVAVLIFTGGNFNCDEVCLEMKADTRGGQTEQETIGLLISALKAGDAELASQYFINDNNGSREKWLKTLLIFKEQGLLDEIADDINEDSVVMIFNEYSGVWKVSGLK